MLAEGQGHGEGSFGIRMVGMDATLHLSDAEREEIGLDGGGALHTPGGIDERLDDLGFDGAFGLAIMEQRLEWRW